MVLVAVDHLEDLLLFKRFEGSSARVFEKVRSLEVDVHHAVFILLRPRVLVLVVEL